MTLTNFPVLAICRRTGWFPELSERPPKDQGAFEAVPRRAPDCASVVICRLPVLRIQEPPPAVGPRIEVEVPVTVLPFQAHFPPVQRNLRIGIERSDVRPGTGAVLTRIGHGGVVRILGIRRPGVLRNIRIVVDGARFGPGPVAGIGAPIPAEARSGIGPATIWRPRTRPPWPGGQ